MTVLTIESILQGDDASRSEYLFLEVDRYKDLWVNFEFILETLKLAKIIMNEGGIDVVSVDKHEKLLIAYVDCILFQCNMSSPDHPIIDRHNATLIKNGFRNIKNCWTCKPLIH